MDSKTLGIVKRLEFFSDLPNEAKQQFAKYLKVRTFDARQTIVKQGDNDPRVLILYQGQLEATLTIPDPNGELKSVHLRYINPPTWIGLTSFLGGSKRSATLRAQTHGAYLEISFDDMRQLLANHLEQATWPILGNILRSLGEKVRAKNRILALLTKDTLKEGGNCETVAVFDSKKYVESSFKPFETDQLRFKFHSSRLTKETAILASGHRGICCFVNDDLDHEVLTILAEVGVEMIALRCSGYNQVDLEAAHRVGIRVARVPAYSPEAVAEHAAAMLLTLNRKIHLAHQRVKTNNFTLDGLVGFNLHGKKIGVIGLGKIGLCFAKIVKGFGCDVGYYDPHSDCRDFAALDLDDLLMTSDVVSLHCPLVKATHHLICEEKLSIMKPSAYLVNTSRGGLIDSEALIQALKTKKLAGAALDVYEEEQSYFFEDFSSDLVTDDLLARLIGMNQVLVTSHQAFLTVEALQNIAQTTYENLNEYFAKSRDEVPGRIELKNEVSTLNH